MDQMDSKASSLQQLVHALQEQFGPEAFPIEHDTNDSSVLYLTSSKNRDISISIVATNVPTETYSVQVKLHGPEHKQKLFEHEGEEFSIPFEIAEDGPYIGLEELLKLFEKYHKL